MVDSASFLGGTTNDLAIEFAERKKYIKYFREKGYPLLDTLYDKKLYGLVDNSFSIVVPTPSTKPFEDPSASVVGLTYTVDMFEKFKQRYYSSEAFQVPKKIRDFKIYRSFEDFEANYKKHELFAINKSINLFLDHFQERKISVGELVKAAEQLIFTDALNGVHFTKSGYCLSPESSIYHTGLYLDLLPEEDGKLDSAKVEILEDPDFECYVGIAYESGFYVDANSPWRLVLDLESPLVKQNILNGRSLSSFELFYSDVYRIKVGLDDYSAIVSLFEKLHIEYHRQAGIDAITLEPNFPPESWLRLLLANRFRELGLVRGHDSLLQSREFSKILKKTVDLYRFYGLSSNLGALGFIENYCSKKLKETLKENENIANFGHRKHLQRDISPARI